MKSLFTTAKLFGILFILSINSAATLNRSMKRYNPYGNESFTKHQHKVNKYKSYYDQYDTYNKKNSKKLKNIKTIKIKESKETKSYTLFDELYTKFTNKSNTNDDNSFVKTIWNFIISHEDKIELVNEYFADLVEKPADLMLKFTISIFSLDKVQKEKEPEKLEKLEKKTIDVQDPSENEVKEHLVNKDNKVNSILEMLQSKVDFGEMKKSFLSSYISTIVDFFMPIEQDESKRKLRKGKDDFTKIYEESKETCVTNILTNDDIFNDLKGLFSKLKQNINTFFYSFFYSNSTENDKENKFSKKIKSLIEIAQNAFNLIFKNLNNCFKTLGKNIWENFSLYAQFTSYAKAGIIATMNSLISTTNLIPINTYFAIFSSIYSFYEYWKIIKIIINFKEEINDHSANLTSYLGESIANLFISLIRSVLGFTSNTAGKIIKGITFLSSAIKGIIETTG